MEGEIDPRLRGSIGAQHPQYQAQHQSSNASHNSLRQPPIDPMHPSVHLEKAASQRRTSADSPGHRHAQGQPYYGVNAALKTSSAPEADVDPEHELDHEQDIEHEHEHEHENEHGIDPKRPRACEACRGLKVRCQPDESNFDGPCKRCAKAGRKCIVTLPSRKRQKKTDSRVAELEKKIDALTASLQARQSGGRNADSESEGYEAEEARRRFSATNMAEGQKTDREDVRRFVGNVPESGPYRDGQSSAQTSEAQSPVTYRSSLSQISGVKRRHSNEGIAQTYGTGTPSTGIRSPSTKPSPKDGPPSIYPFLMPKAPKNLPQQNLEPSTVQPPLPSHDYTDVIDRGLLSSDTASVIFDKYAKEMIQHIPAVVFPEDITAGEVRKTMPILFLAILSVGSGAMYPDLQRLLTREVTKVFSERIMCSGQKSLELVQALLVTVMWYWPPEHFEELNFYQLTNIALSMAIDLGLYRKPLGDRKSLMQHSGMCRDKRKAALMPDSRTAESRRTWLACYFACSITSMSLRRPTLIRWTAYNEECVQFLETSPEAAPTDKLLCTWVKAQRIAEDTTMQFAMDDPDVALRLVDTNVQYALKALERQLAQWKTTLPEDAGQLPLTILGHQINLYMHEIALHVDHNVDDFKPPFTEETLKGGSEYPWPLTNIHINALSDLVRSIHGVLDGFMSFDLHVVRSLPTFYFVRCMYTIAVLIKMYFGVTNPKSELGKIFTKNDLKTDVYVTRIVDFFRDAAEGDLSRPAKKFVIILLMIKRWFFKQTEDGSRASDQRADRGIQRPSSTYGGMSTNGDGNYTDPSSQRSEGGTVPVPEYSSANTPLQLLSEVAMGSKSGSRSDAGNVSKFIGPGAANYYTDWNNNAITGGGQPQTPGFPLQGVAGVPLPDGNLYGGIENGGFDKISGDMVDPALQFSLGEGDFGFGSIFMDNSFMTSIMDGTPNLFENWA